MCLVAYEGVAGNDVVKTQVLGTATELGRNGVRVSVVVFERVDRFRRGSRELGELRDGWRGLPVSARLLPRLPGLPGLRLAGITLRAVLRRFNGVVHCRGMKSAVVAMGGKARGRSHGIVVDFRGAEPEEVVDLIRRGARPERGLLAPSSDALVRRLGEIELRAVKGLDRAVCVSRALSMHLRAKYPGLEGRISVVHCGATSDFRFRVDDRERIRRELGLGESLTLCYLGGLTPVHRPDRVATFAAGMARAADVPVTLLVLTGDDSTVLEDLAGQEPRLKVITTRVCREDVPAYLSAADAGLLMLDEAFRNTVSFPVKFSEYACCGLPVIATTSAQDPARHVRESGLGALVAPDEGDWTVCWPTGESLAEAARRIRLTSHSERSEFAERAARCMRFDFTAELLLEVYRAAGRHARIDRGLR